MKIKLGVFFGGKSTEHEVSIITAIQAIENMDTEKYDIIPIYIAKDNKMYVGEKVGDIRNYKDIEKLKEESTQVTLSQKDNKVVLLRCNKKMFENSEYDYIDIAFPIVHGTNVEDGTLQGFLKMYNLPYVGCDVT
jgi:D-alanine-D-alanine ligase